MLGEVDVNWSSSVFQVSNSRNCDAEHTTLTLSGIRRGASRQLTYVCSSCGSAYVDWVWLVQFSPAP